MSDSIFDLEQKIMQAWNMVDDVEAIYHYLGDDPMFAGMSAEAQDKQANLLLGLVSLYGFKFEKLWECFEEVCKEHHRRGNALEHLKVPSEWDLQIELAKKDVRIKELEEQVRILSNERESFDDERNESNITSEWNEDRMNIIGQNGNDGLHYETTQLYSIDDATAKEWDEMARKYYKGEQ